MHVCVDMYAYLHLYTCSHVCNIKQDLAQYCNVVTMYVITCFEMRSLKYLVLLTGLDSGPTAICSVH